MFKCRFLFIYKYVYFSVSILDTYLCIIMNVNKWKKKKNLNKIFFPTIIHFNAFYFVFGVLHQADSQKLQVRERNACLEALRAWHVFHDRGTIKHCLKLKLIPCGDQQASQCLGTHKGNEASKRHQLELELELDHRCTHIERDREALSDTMLPDALFGKLFVLLCRPPINKHWLDCKLCG